MADAAISALFDSAQDPIEQFGFCVACDATFPSGNGNRKFCADCKRERDRQRDSKRRPSKGILGSLFTCEQCGASCPTKRGGQKYCDDCRRHAINAKQREKKKADRKAAGQVVFGEGVSCIQCGETFQRRAYKHFRCDSCLANNRAKKAQEATILVCKDCGNVEKRKSPNQIRCVECAATAETTRQKKYNKEWFCIDCGAETSRKKRCDECKKAHVRRIDAEYKRRLREDPETRERLNALKRGRPRTDRQREYANAYWKDRIKNDPKVAVHKRMHAQVLRGLKVGKGGRSWQDLVGYTLDELMRHLERQFTSGMSWENRDEWHIDHIVPVAAFNFSSEDDEGFRACWALTNLRPLWKWLNRKKWHERTHLI